MMRISTYNRSRIRSRLRRHGGGADWLLLAGSLAIVAAMACVAAADENQDDLDESLRFFERKVRPILVERCFECHSGSSKILQGGLRLDQRPRVLAGGDTGPAVVPGNPDDSLLLRSLRYDGDLQMPPTGKLPDSEIAVLRTWIELGLPQVDSKDGVAAGEQPGTGNRSRGASWESRLQHWAFQPLPATRRSPLAAIDGHRAELAPLAGWVRDPIDGFVLREWLDRGLTTTGVADAAALLRRATFDLTGLPPTWDEQDEFQREDRPDAYERLVDRLLASPKLGERWGRHWLDLTRYCDVPESWRESLAKPWLYRDWVVQAMNRDVPYDHFVRQQLAADLLPNCRPEDNAALGMLGLSPTYWKELKLDPQVIKQVVAEEWEERIEAIGATFLGLTLACSRCHDHKYDPITMRDYYGLAGVLASIRLDDRPMFSESAANDVRNAHFQAKQLQTEIDKLAAVTDKTEESEKQLAAKREALTAVKQTPHFDSLWAYGVTEASLYVLPDGPHRTKLDYRLGEPQDVAIQIRGNPANAGTVVPRGFVAALAFPGQELRFRQGSGRLELADAMVTNASHLTARTLVNRIWRHHFGRGLVATPSNLGIQGQPPTHPALLDDLAQRFIDGQWSTKKLHRALMVTATYRQAARVEPLDPHGESAANDAMDRGRDRDPDNVYYWRSAIRRLEFEAWRDAVLAVTDQLDHALGGPPASLADQVNRRRTLYGQVKRRELSDMQRLHDFPDPVSHSAAREPTTTPLQQLFALNSPWLQQLATEMAQRLAVEAPEAPATQIGQAYRAILLRPPNADELSTAVEFIAASNADGTSAASGSSGTSGIESLAQLIHALLASNEFQYLD